MNNKRKDCKGRILRTGESQRKDGVYQYRYIDNNGKRGVIYSSDLNELRSKEKEIQKLLNSGEILQESNITVVELMEHSVKLKANLSLNTMRLYQYSIKLIQETSLGNMKISQVKPSSIQRWIVKQYNDGKKFGTIKTAYSLLKNAFNQAFINGLLQKNPCCFQLSDIIKNDRSIHASLTKEQQESLLSFLEQDALSRPLYDITVILLETGLRISEFLGLTINDLDFDKRKVNIDHQLLHNTKKGFYISYPKSKSGNRVIPMTDKAYESLINLLNNRAKVKREKKIDGYSGFLLITNNGNPKSASDIDDRFQRMYKRYCKSDNIPISKLTPHILRHTFCSNLIMAGVDIKSAQYLMGHSDISMTLNVYTHSNYQNAMEQLIKIGTRSA